MSWLLCRRAGKPSEAARDRQNTCCQIEKGDFGVMPYGKGEARNTDGEAQKAGSQAAIPAKALLPVRRTEVQASCTEGDLSYQHTLIHVVSCDGGKHRAAEQAGCQKSRKKSQRHRFTFVEFGKLTIWRSAAAPRAPTILLLLAPPAEPSAATAC